MDKKQTFYQKYGKRFLDIIISLSAIIILSPLLVLVYILVKVKLGSPVIFTQERPGKDEKIFKIYKFRSMTNEKDDNGSLLPNELRITKFGTALRATSLDELPQLFNVLNGQMSIIGPRPLLPEYLPYYTIIEKQRHNLRPGLTGLAQINGRNQIKSWDDRFSYDIDYVENCSLKLDIKIFLQTIKKVIKKSDVLDIDNTVIGRLDETRSK